MARPLKYPKKRMVSLDDETDKKFVKIAIKNKQKPSVRIRVLVEKDVKANS